MNYLIIFLVFLTIIFYYQYKSYEFFNNFAVQNEGIQLVNLHDFFLFIEHFKNMIHHTGYDGFNYYLYANANQLRNDEFMRINNQIDKLLLELENMLSDPTNEYNRINNKLIDIYGLWKTDAHNQMFYLDNPNSKRGLNINLLSLKEYLGIHKQTNFLTNTFREKNNITNIIQSIIKIINTSYYREYLTEQRFAIKYAGVVFNPFMIRL